MKKILVIEDSSEERLRAREAVEATGAYCYVADDLEEALFQIEGGSEISWDAVVTDLHFPGFQKRQPEPHGFEVALACKEKSIPCVICTDLNRHNVTDCEWKERLAERIGVSVVNKNTADAWQKAVELVFIAL